MNLKEKSRWKYLFIIVSPNANKTGCWILKETKIYLLIKNYLERVMNQNFFTIFTEKPCQIMFWRDAKEDFYKSFIWNTAQTGIDTTVLSASFFPNV